MKQSHWRYVASAASHPVGICLLLTAVCLSASMAQPWVALVALLGQGVGVLVTTRSKRFRRASDLAARRRARARRRIARAPLVALASGDASNIAERLEMLAEAGDAVDVTSGLDAPTCEALADRYIELAIAHRKATELLRTVPEDIIEASRRELRRSLVACAPHVRQHREQRLQVLALRRRHLEAVRQRVESTAARMALIRELVALAEELTRSPERLEPDGAELEQAVDVVQRQALTSVAMAQVDALALGWQSG
ncbi:MAG: hypothetical protein KC503_47220 [Myxococcales bacterium]|nr:hypothetical protein [Myxococcales bacterium]